MRFETAIRIVALLFAFQLVTGFLKAQKHAL
jgi:hypothetical protein